MAENFDLIFGRNASQQYAWSDNDYQNGWETIGSIPPTAAQFDALQRRADMKSQDLNSRLIAVERYITGGNKREPNTGYTVGTVLTYDGLPMDWVLECIVGGISSATDITLPSPRVEGARILDGTVTWALRKIATYGGIGYRQSSTPYHTGSIAFSTSLPAGLYLDCTVAGTTGSGDLVVTRKNVGEIVTDGTVTWTVRKFADTTDATTTTNGLMSAADKIKIDGIEANANNYSLPAATGSVRGGVTIGSNISLSGDKISLTSNNVTNALGYTPPTQDTTYGIASPSTNGLMSASDKVKLDGIEANANNYSLPAATGSTRGGVTVGSNLTLSGDMISVSGTNVQNALGFNPATRDVVTSSTNGLMTPAMLAHLDSVGGSIVAASLTTNGFVKFSNGFIVQWGVVAGEAYGTAFTFPIAFSSAVYGILGSPKSAGYYTTPASFDDSKTSLTGSSAAVYGANTDIYWYAYGR